jgi:hypothetical protein
MKPFLTLHPMTWLLLAALVLPSIAAAIVLLCK